MNDTLGSIRSTSDRLDLGDRDRGIASGRRAKYEGGGASGRMRSRAFLALRLVARRRDAHTEYSRSSDAGRDGRVADGLG